MSINYGFIGKGFGASINHLDSREGKVGKTNDHEGGGDQNTQKSFHVVYG